jgi:ketosteroid isomerase-like protein
VVGSLGPMSAKHPNAALIELFYQAFARLDAATMAAAYASDAHFSDAVFTDLRGADVGAMWRMLAQRAKGFSLTFRDVTADDVKGSAHWEARYKFSKTGREVHNVVDAAFVFSNGRIATHEDRFDFWRWTRMAFGVPGVMLGWTPVFKGKVREEARKGLEEFMREERAPVAIQAPRS